jgi:hypothetical protein
MARLQLLPENTTDASAVSEPARRRPAAAITTTGAAAAQTPPEPGASRRQAATRTDMARRRLRRRLKRSHCCGRQQQRSQQGREVHAAADTARCGAAAGAGAVLHGGPAGCATHAQQAGATFNRWGCHLTFRTATHDKCTACSVDRRPSQHVLFKWTVQRPCCQRSTGAQLAFHLHAYSKCACPGCRRLFIRRCRRSTSS